MKINESFRTAIPISESAISRLHRHLFKDIFEYEDTSFDYIKTENTPYLEYTVNRMRRNRKRRNSFVHIRRDPLTTRYCENGPYERFVKPNDAFATPE